MDVCTYLAPLDEKEVQRNWVFSGVGNRGKRPPTSGSSFGLSWPFPHVFKSCSPMSGRSYWGVCTVKLAVERVPQKDLLWRAFLHPSNPTQPPPPGGSAHPFKGWKSRQFKLLAKPYCFQMLFLFNTVWVATFCGANVAIN